ncbi:hypothetical protein Dimus_008260, partial [Dionaea muscipula]
MTLRPMLFCCCPFAGDVLRGALAQIHLRSRLLDWQSLVKWHMKVAKGRSWRAKCIKLVFVAGIYNIWIERNLRILQNKFCAADEVTECVLYLIRLLLPLAGCVSCLQGLLLVLQVDLLCLMVCSGEGDQVCGVSGVGWVGEEKLGELIVSTKPAACWSGPPL